VNFCNQFFPFGFCRRSQFLLEFLDLCAAVSPSQKFMSASDLVSHTAPPTHGVGENFKNFADELSRALESIFNSPYAKRPEGSRKSGLDFAQTFGTGRNINF
jgi:hypothetical protein